MTSPQPTPTHNSNLLQDRYLALKQAHERAGEQFSAAINKGNIAEARQLHNQLEEALRDFREKAAKDFVAVKDGRFLLRHEHEALKAFSDNNSIELEQVLSKVVISDCSVVTAKFNKLGVSTLEGLEGLTNLVTLDVSENIHLTSLAGIPRARLRNLYAKDCGLSGDLTAISLAQELTDLKVGGNRQLTSLRGIPTRSIRRIEASWTGLSGDLSELSAAQEIVELVLAGNADIRSLKGAPTEKLTKLDIAFCDLIGDLTEISEAENMEEFDISGNINLHSLRGLPCRKLVKLQAQICGLTGAIPEIAEAHKLEVLVLSQNDKLDRSGAQKVIDRLKTKHSLMRFEM